jgi:Ribbon-helix-helix domain
MVSKSKGKRRQLLGYYDSGALKHLQLLSKLTRVPQSVYLREALDDLLRKYSVLRKMK